MKRKSIVVRVDRCMACHNCELACGIAHATAGSAAAAIQAGEQPGHRIHVETYGGKAVPLQCRHCEEAACVMACPTGAIYRRSKGAPVLFDKERCIGCRMCVEACPFGVVTVSPDGKGVLKCDLCVRRLAKGQDPACVCACPTKALAFEEVEESNRDKRRRLAEKLVAAQKQERNDT